MEEYRLSVQNKGGSSGMQDQAKEKGNSFFEGLYGGERLQFGGDIVAEEGGRILNYGKSRKRGRKLI